MRTDTVVHIPVSVGEFLDKISVLRIKERRIKDPVKLAHVRAELAALSEYIRPGDEEFIEQLEEINEEIWIEVDSQWAMLKGKVSATTEDFCELSRRVLINNDQRFEIKRRANIAANSNLREEKSYAGR